VRVWKKVLKAEAKKRKKRVSNEIPKGPTRVIGFHPSTSSPSGKMSWLRSALLASDPNIHYRKIRF
jgi:hypothetical protein